MACLKIQWPDFTWPNNLSPANTAEPQLAEPRCIVDAPILDVDIKRVQFDRKYYESHQLFHATLRCGWWQKEEIKRSHIFLQGSYTLTPARNLTC
ncbi:unnamed protein product [Leptosia nina]|uniref:Uncharacterized protein n=1 Tax=Leptosia nina TaxID=320188 RepID=A0AAV1JBH6_9NEOP